MSKKNDFKLLTDLEHIKMRPAMYIGSVAREKFERFIFGKVKEVEYVPGLVKIIDEIIDNSVDEAIRTNFKNGCSIDVTITPTSVQVKDNGNGIPQVEVETPEGTKIPQAVAAWTRTKAGSNFVDDGNQMGMNGVGSSLTNAFSKSFKGTTCDGTDKIVVSCTDGSTDIQWKMSKAKSKGTSVEFEPDFSHFGTTEITQNEMDIIHDRLIGLSVVFPELSITFNGKKVNTSFRQYIKLYSDENVLLDLENVSLGIAPSEEGFKFVSFVNGLNTKNGGSHIDFIMDEVANEMIPIIKRRHKIDVTRARIKECLTLVIIVKNLRGMKFDSQTKERLTNTQGEVRDHMIQGDMKHITKLATQIMSKESLYMPIIESALARKMAADKAAATRAQNQAKRAKVAKHIRANKSGDPKANTTLFITEGDSAIGYLLMVRDQNLHGGLPLRGKVKNTWGDSPAEIIKNKEIFDIMACTGLRFDEDPFTYEPDAKEWFNVIINGEEILVNKNDEIFIEGVWKSVRELI